jgi:translation initiation factor IF-3
VGFRRRRWREVAPEKDKVRVNRAIRVPEVRVINHDGQQLGVMPTDAARDIALRVGLDLVEVSPNGQPPVCKIMDYGRYKYEQKKKDATARRQQHQSQLKEVKFRPRIDDHDLDFKLKNARRFLVDGDKVKATVMFRGREIVHKQIGHDLLRRVTDELAEIAKAETYPQMEGRMLTMIFAPDRKAIERYLREHPQEEREELDEPEELEGEEAIDSLEAEAAEAGSDTDKEQGSRKDRRSQSRRRGGESLEDEAQALLEEIENA